MSLSNTIHIKPTGSAKKQIKINKIAKEMKEIYGDLTPQEMQEMRLDPEIINHICNKVEHEITKKYKTDKKIVVLDIIRKLVTNLSDEDKKIISAIIENLHRTGQILENTILRASSRFFLGVLKKTVSISKI